MGNEDQRDSKGWAGGYLHLLPLESFTESLEALANYSSLWITMGYNLNSSPFTHLALHYMFLNRAGGLDLTNMKTSNPSLGPRSVDRNEGDFWWNRKQIFNMDLLFSYRGNSEPHVPRGHQRSTYRCFCSHRAMSLFSAKCLGPNVGMDKVAVSQSTWPTQQVSQAMGYTGGSVTAPLLCCSIAFQAKNKQTKHIYLL